ncbi:MAG: hypothetical protein H7256_10765 [Bdellovibrio sp.]|nr:hypothetical protein [Bdellovibrio sp.]
MVLKVVAFMSLSLFFGFIASCATTSTTKSCDPQMITYGPSDFQVNVNYYQSSATVAKSLIILPPTGGPNYIDRSYAKKFCAEGYDVYLVNNWTGDSEDKTDLAIHQRLYTRGQKAISIVVSQIKSSFIGLLGTSVGALHSAVAANTQEKINAVFLIVGGAPITQIVVTSDQKAMRDVRDVRNKRYGFNSDQEYLMALQKVFLLEPMKLGDLYKSKDIGMVLAENDTTVPYSSQLDLQMFFNPKATYTLPSSHFWAIVKTWFFHSKEVFDFFENSAKRM